MQITRAGAAQGGVETSQGKASVPVAASGRGPQRSAGSAGGSLGSTKGKSAVKWGGSRGQAGHSHTLTSLVLFFSEGPAWPVAAAPHRALANSPSRNVAKWISSSPSPAQDLAVNKASSLDSSKPPGIPAMLLLYRVPEKKRGRDKKKKGKKSLPGCSRAAGGGREC